jgi:hypothetical protein
MIYQKQVANQGLTEWCREKRKRIVDKDMHRWNDNTMKWESNNRKKNKLLMDEVSKERKIALHEAQIMNTYAMNCKLTYIPDEEFDKFADQYYEKVRNYYYARVFVQNMDMMWILFKEIEESDKKLQDQLEQAQKEKEKKEIEERDRQERERKEAERIQKY